MLSKCNIVTDDTKKELASHGTIQFPLACYSNDLSEAEIPWHWHDEFEIIVCVSGKAIVNVAQKWKNQTVIEKTFACARNYF